MKLRHSVKYLLHKPTRKRNTPRQLLEGGQEVFPGEVSTGDMFKELTFYSQKEITMQILIKKGRLDVCS